MSICSCIRNICDHNITQSFRAPKVDASSGQLRASHRQHKGDIHAKEGPSALSPLTTVTMDSVGSYLYLDPVGTGISARSCTVLKKV